MTKKLTIAQLKKVGKDQYNCYISTLKNFLQQIYPQIKIKGIAPGCFGGNPDLQLKEKTLFINKGTYKSNKHFHTADTRIMAIEDGRQKLNFPGKPLILLMSYIYNGDYRNLSKVYYLFGQNEDESYFLHKMRPNVGETGSIKTCRSWMWNLKKGEKIKQRQGDLAFIEKDKVPYQATEKSTSISFGNHNLLATGIKQTKTKIYLLNPRCYHHEHNAVCLEGWYEVRLAKAWRQSTAD